jgi:hypothetical protein
VRAKIQEKKAKRELQIMQNREANLAMQDLPSVKSEITVIFEARLKRIKPLTNKSSTKIG